MKNNISESNTLPRGAKRCRIPQRLPQSPSRLTYNGEYGKNSQKALVPAPTDQLQQIIHTAPKYLGTDTRPKSAKSSKSSKSASVKDGSIKHTPRSARLDPRYNGRRSAPQPKRSAGPAQKNTVISVPVVQMQAKSYASIRHSSNHCLPTQEIIRKREEDEIYCDSLDLKILQEITDQDLEIKTEELDELRSTWEAKLNQFQVLKMELEDRQKTVLEFYALLRKMHAKMKALGEDIDMPSTTDDLWIMNVAKVSPDQLLQLCVNQTPEATFTTDSFSVDLQQYCDAPNKLLAACEQVLRKRQDIIDWFDKLKEQHGITMSNFLRKINEFNAETEMLTSNLASVRKEFLNKFSEIIDKTRRGMAVTMQFQVRTEELTYELSELNSLNEDLRKQVLTANHFQSQHGKHKLEELEKELKEERCKKTIFKDRLTRAEAQIKTFTERAAQLEVALEQARSQNWSLERTVQHLNEQNKKMQSDNDTELKKLKKSIRENTLHLEEIAEARKKLQVEKEGLEKRLADLSDSYNESIDNMKTEMNTALARMLDTERKYDEERKQRAELEQKLETLCAEVLESELRYTEILEALHEKETILAQALARGAELEATKEQLQLVNKEVEDCKERLTKQNETIKEIECNFLETIDLEKSLRSDIANKEEYIAELEKKDALLEQQLKENENQMECYVQQLNILKGDIEQLQNDFGDFDNLGQLHDMINKQRTKLNEVTREKEELTAELKKRNSEIDRLAAELKKKDSEIDRHLEHLSAQDNLVEERDAVIKMLKQKEEEHAGIIKLLRNNLEIRTQTDSEVRNEMIEKNNEIKSLQSNLDTRKQQISELEKIIVTLEDQLRNLNFQRRKELDRLHKLEKALSDYETYHMEARHSPVDSVDNLDNLIKVLEDELDTTYDPKHQDEGFRNKQNTKKYIGDVNVNQVSDNIALQRSHSPTRSVMGNFVKKTYLTNDEEQKAENLDRKIAITQMATPRLFSSIEASVMGKGQGPKLGHLMQLPPEYARDQLLMKNLHFLTTNQQLDQKKCKMYKLAGHRL